MRTPLLILLLLAAMALPALAQDLDRPPYIIAEAAVTTDYMWRGFNQLDGRPAFQPWLLLNAGESGFTFFTWGSWSLAHREETWIKEADEWDFELAWFRQFDNTALQLGYYQVNWFNREDWPRKTNTLVREVFAALTLSKLPLQPRLKVNYEMDKDTGNDLYIEADVDYTIYERVQPIVFSLHGGYFEAEWADVANVSDVTFGVTIPVAGSGGVSFNPSFALTWIPDRKVNPREFEAYAGIGISWAY